MKVIKHGTMGTPFWVGRTMTCKRCGCEYILEAHDRVCQTDGRCVAATCPMEGCLNVNSLHVDDVSKRPNQ